LFEDRETGTLVGYVTWRIRKVRLPPSHKQHRVIELHYIGLVPAYQGMKTTTGESIASQMFATAEAAARCHPQAMKRPDMRTVLEVEVGNDKARDIYIKRWQFELLGPRTAEGTGRTYEVLSRAAPSDDDETTALSDAEPEDA
jgi:ribosomal protein S18 acetylase RimI-like enzyme